MLLVMSEQRASGAVNDRLGSTGGTRRVEDVERVVEWELVQTQPGLLPQGAQPLLPVLDASFRQCTGMPGKSNRGNISQPLAELSHDPTHVVLLATIAVGGGGEEQLRFDLPESRPRSFQPEIRGTAGEDDTHSGAGEQECDGLGPVRSEGRYPVTLHQPFAGETLLDAGYQLTQLPVAQAPLLTRFVRAYQRRLLRVCQSRRKEERFGIVDRRSRKPVDIHHVIARKGPLPASPDGQPAEAEVQLPEVAGLTHRPVVQAG